MAEDNGGLSLSLEEVKMQLGLKVKRNRKKQSERKRG